eukprot:m.31677 g.31677  ORF g.31677 m.31677 type:complete len:567 (-) comp9336_c1_seq1:26-1726(-)
MEARQRGQGAGGNVMRTVLGVLNHPRQTKGSYRLQTNIGGYTPDVPRDRKLLPPCEVMSPVIEVPEFETGTRRTIDFSALLNASDAHDTSENSPSHLDILARKPLLRRSRESRQSHVGSLCIRDSIIEATEAHSGPSTAAASAATSAVSSPIIAAREPIITASVVSLCEYDNVAGNVQDESPTELPGLPLPFQMTRLPVSSLARTVESAWHQQEFSPSSGSEGLATPLPGTSFTARAPLSVSMVQATTDMQERQQTVMAQATTMLERLRARLTARGSASPSPVSKRPAPESTCTSKRPKIDLKEKEKDSLQIRVAPGAGRARGYRASILMESPSFEQADPSPIPAAPSSIKHSHVKSTSTVTAAATSVPTTATNAHTAATAASQDTHLVSTRESMASDASGSLFPSNAATRASHDSAHNTTQSGNFDANTSVCVALLNTEQAREYAACMQVRLDELEQHNMEARLKLENTAAQARARERELLRRIETLRRELTLARAAPPSPSPPPMLTSTPLPSFRPLSLLPMTPLAPAPPPTRPRKTLLQRIRRRVAHMWTHLRPNRQGAQVLD